MTEPSSGFTAFMVNELKCATRARLIAMEIRSAAVALSGDLIGVDEALAWVNDAGGLGLIILPSSLAGASS